MTQDKRWNVYDVRRMMKFIDGRSGDGSLIRS